MECENCKKDIPSDSKFCVHCGEKVEIKKEKKKEQIKEDIPKSLEEIKNHLEFIGYEVDENEFTDNGVVKTFASHPNRANLNITYFPTLEFMMLVANYSFKKISSETKKNRLLEVINRINNNTFITAFSVSEEINLITCATWYPNSYSKKDFSRFVDFFESEITRKLQTEELQNLIVEK